MNRKGVSCLPSKTRPAWPGDLRPVQGSHFGCPWALTAVGSWQESSAVWNLTIISPCIGEMASHFGPQFPYSYKEDNNAFTSQVCRENQDSVYKMQAHCVAWGGLLLVKRSSEALGRDGSSDSPWSCSLCPHLHGCTPHPTIVDDGKKMFLSHGCHICE